MPKARASKGALFTFGGSETLFSALSCHELGLRMIDLEKVWTERQVFSVLTSVYFQGLVKQ